MTQHKAHPEDILVAATMQEARLYRQFLSHQILTASVPHRLYGRKFRRAYLTPLFGAAPNANEILQRLDFEVRVGRGEIRWLSDEEWQPEPPASLLDKIAALSASTSSSLDYETGYEAALADVIALIHEQIVEGLTG